MRDVTADSATRKVDFMIQTGLDIMNRQRHALGLETQTFVSESHEFTFPVDAFGSVLQHLASEMPRSRTTQTALIRLAQTCERVFQSVMPVLYEQLELNETVMEALRPPPRVDVDPGQKVEETSRPPETTRPNRQFRRFRHVKRLRIGRFYEETSRRILYPDAPEWPFRAARFISFTFDFWVYLSAQIDVTFPVSHSAANWKTAFAPGAHVCVETTISRDNLEYTHRFYNGFTSQDLIDRWTEYRACRLHLVRDYAAAFCRFEWISSFTVHGIQCGEVAYVHQSGNTILDFEIAITVGQHTTSCQAEWLDQLVQKRYETLARLAVSISRLPPDFGGTITFRHLDRLWYHDPRYKLPPSSSPEQRSLFRYTVMTAWKRDRDKYPIDFERLDQLEDRLIFENDDPKGVVHRCGCCLKTDLELCQSSYFRGRRHGPFLICSTER